MENTRAMKQRGFTLVEVVVAMAIAAIALVALVTALGQTTKNTAHLREKLFAQWVASNAVNQMWLTTNFPAKGKQEGDETLGGLEWRWVREVTETPNPLVRRVDISVYRLGLEGSRSASRDIDDDSAPLAKLTTFASEAIQIRQKGGEASQNNSPFNRGGLT